MEPRPVSVITGYLGSGKTTLLNRLLTEPAMADTAVIINEFGEIAIDHLLVESAIENTVVLENGCVCCTVRGDLVDTVLDLNEKARRGLVPAFSRVLIETTGLADPGPIIHTLASEAALKPLVRLHAVIATVDAVNGSVQLDRFAEPARQAALADAILMTKTDIADKAATAALRRRLAALNPGAVVREVSFGCIAADELFRYGHHHRHDDVAALHSWIGGGDGRPHEGDGHRNEGHGQHTSAVCAAALTLDGPIAWEALSRWLQSVLSLRGSDILRLKGLVNVSGCAGPVVVQAVHHLLHPPATLARWPDADRRTRVVVIAQGLSAAGLQASLEAAAAAHRDAA
ncbi:MAG TPA: GTP-binding protein [Hyphomicrobiaceae bacterium]|nr:GTP-binding protein [Hyphomicrobiaceae bacterium]